MKRTIIIILLLISMNVYSDNMFGEQGYTYSVATVSGSYINLEYGDIVSYGSLVKFYPSTSSKGLLNNLTEGEEYIVSYVSSIGDDGSSNILVSYKKMSNIVDVSGGIYPFLCVVSGYTSYIKDFADVIEFNNSVISLGLNGYNYDNILLESDSNLRFPTYENLSINLMDLSLTKVPFYSYLSLTEFDFSEWLNLRDTYSGIFRISGNNAVDFYIDDEYSFSADPETTLDVENSLLYIKGDFLDEGTVIGFSNKYYFDDIELVDLDESGIYVIEFDKENINQTYVPTDDLEFAYSSNRLYELDLDSETSSLVTEVKYGIKDITHFFKDEDYYLCYLTESKQYPIGISRIDSPYVSIYYDLVSSPCDGDGYLKFGFQNFEYMDPVNGYWEISSILSESKEGTQSSIFYAVGSNAGLLLSANIVVDLSAIDISDFQDIGEVIDTSIDLTTLCIISLHKGNLLSVIKVNESFEAEGYGVYDLSEEVFDPDLFYKINKRPEGGSVELIASSLVGFVTFTVELDGGSFDYINFHYLEYHPDFVFNAFVNDVSNENYYFAYKDYLIKFDPSEDEYFITHSFGGEVIDLDFQGGSLYLTVSNVYTNTESEYPKSIVVKYATVGDIDFQEEEGSPISFSNTDIPLLTSFRPIKDYIGSYRLPSPFEVNSKYLLSNKRFTYSFINPYNMSIEYQTRGALRKRLNPRYFGADR